MEQYWSVMRGDERDGWVCVGTKNVYQGAIRFFVLFLLERNSDRKEEKVTGNKHGVKLKQPRASGVRCEWWNEGTRWGR